MLYDPPGYCSNAFAKHDPPVLMVGQGNTKNALNTRLLNKVKCSTALLSFVCEARSPNVGCNVAMQCNVARTKEQELSRVCGGRGPNDGAGQASFLSS